MTPALQLRRERIAKALDLGNGLLVITAGHPVPLPENSDQCHPFWAHSEYHYLSGENTEGGVIVFDPLAPATEQWIDFVPLVTEAERIWEGRTQVAGRPLGELDDWRRAREGRRIALLGSGLANLRHDTALSARTRALLTHARRPKEASEIDLVRQAAACTQAGFAAVAATLRPGVSERELQIELESAFLRAGAERPGFGSIVGSGPNAAILHFPPSSRRVCEGEFVLVDAGARIGHYTADVTRTFCVGKADAFRRDLYQTVLEAQERAIARCLPGKEWKELHLACAVDLMSGLQHMGIVKGRPEQLVEQATHTLFFPHGLGHLVGLGVRDASGTLPDRVRDTNPALSTLRMDLPLEENYLVTVEPGLYFIPELLREPGRRFRHRDSVNWDLVEAHAEVGGVRIEDDVWVRSSGPEVLTAAIPKQLQALN